MNLHLPRLILLAGLLVGVTGSAVAADNLRLDIQPAFEGQSVENGVSPMVVEIANLGTDTRGVLRVTSNSWEMEYPVELPRGANKRLMTYPAIYFGNVTFSLMTDQGNVEKAFTPTNAVPYGSSSLNVLLVSDMPGQMSFVRGSNTSSTTSNPEHQALTLSDCYGKPGDLPTRPVGYHGIGAIMLGATSERLSDEEVQAIKLWVSTGGTLVFVGGASAPVLSDARWADLLPERDLHVAQLRNSQILANLGGIPPEDLSEAGGVPPGPKDSSVNVPAPILSVMTGEPVRGATFRREGSIVVTSEKPYGLGTVQLLSFNPFENPLNKWSGRGEALAKLLRGQSGLLASAFLSPYSQIMPNAGELTPPVTAAMGAGSIRLTYHGASSDSVEDDPFSMKLPPASRIFGILVGYFFIVVPLNFLILRKLKRGEWAWFTAPLISLAFAGILFTSARGLYGAKMSTISKGIIIGQEGNSDAVFVGNTQMFIPTGGSYDLKLQGVDDIGSVDDDPYTGSWRGGSDDAASFDPVDNGEVKVPAFAANNLAFKRIVYRQRIPLSKWLNVKLEPAGGGTARCEVVNTGPYVLSDANLIVGGRAMSLGSIQPGQRQAVQVTFGSGGSSEDLTSDDVRRFTLRKDRVALSGTLEGFRPGPQIGVDVPGKSQIKVALFSAWQGGTR